MLTKIMKFVSIATLILAAILWKYVPSFELLVRFVVSLGAVMVALQAMRARKYAWAVAFCVITVLFNPFIPTGAFSGNLALSVILGCAVIFGASVSTLQTRPVLSIPSITDRSPGSESL